MWLVKKKRFFFIIGIVLAFLGLGYFSIGLFVPTTLVDVLPHSKSLTVDRDIAGEDVDGGPSVRGTIRTTLNIKVDSPERVSSDDSFLIIATAYPESVAWITTSSSAREPSSGPEFSQENLRAYVEDYLKSGEVAFDLSIAGAKIEPSGKNPLSANGRAQWSVRLENVGSVQGFLRPTFPKTAVDNERRIDFSVEEFIPVNINVYKKIMTLNNLISVATAFLGSFLTLPGILAFLDDRRKKREEGDAKKTSRA